MAKQAGYLRAKTLETALEGTSYQRSDADSQATAANLPLEEYAYNFEAPTLSSTAGLASVAQDERETVTLVTEGDKDKGPLRKQHVGRVYFLTTGI